MARRALQKIERPKNHYFTGAKEHLEFVHTGCTLLDCALGGGIGPLGRMANVVGDKSTAKTGLACEVVTNFVKQYPDGKPAYRDAEFAFDKPYAAAMGMPVDKVDFGDENPDKRIRTVEDFHRDLEAYLEALGDARGIYVVDSLDALSSEGELDADIAKASYGTGKAKTLSRSFAQLVGKVEQSRCLLLIISQVRDNIGVTFGERHKRSGGHAMDFYASQVLWLAVRGSLLKRSIKGVERPYGVPLKGNVKKNKVGLPFRKCDFDYLFGYGIDDIGASIDWLDEVKRLEDAGLKKSDAADYLKQVAGMDQAQYEIERDRLSPIIKKVWEEIETSFLPSRSKYT